MFRSGRVGAHEEKAPVRVLCLTGPHLLPVNHKIVTVLDCTRLQRCEIRTRAGLRIPLAPNFFCWQDLWEEALLLLFSAPVHERGTQQSNAVHVHPGRGARPGELFVEDDLLNDRGAATTVLFGPPDADPAAFVEFLVPGLVSLPSLIVREFFIAP